MGMESLPHPCSRRQAPFPPPPRGGRWKPRRPALGVAREAGQRGAAAAVQWDGGEGAIRGRSRHLAAIPGARTTISARSRPGQDHRIPGCGGVPCSGVARRRKEPRRRIWPRVVRETRPGPLGRQFARGAARRDREGPRFFLRDFFLGFEVPTRAWSATSPSRRSAVAARQRAATEGD